MTNIEMWPMPKMSEMDTSEVSGMFMSVYPVGWRLSPFSNFTRIKAMTIEQMAEFLSKAADHAACVGALCRTSNCVESWIEWLQQEADAND